jgi:redox-sensitive bicupin YhaK (pirin superfamily)
VRDDEVVFISNFGDKAGELEGWTLSDKVGVRFEFPAGAKLAEFSVISVYGKYENVDAENFSADGLGLNDRGDELTLRDADGNVVDVLRWESVDVGQEVFPGDFQ